MVFSNLQANEKDAFFSLLDEYFSSRPDIFANVGTPDAAADAGARGAAVSAVHRAMASNPEATAKLVSAGLKHGVPKSSPYSAAASDPEVNNMAGRVAAASLAFSARNTPSSSTAPPPVSEKPSTFASARKFGSDIDTSSAKSAFGSLRNSIAGKPATPTPPAPSAFNQRQSSFAPPPGRRVAPAASTPEPEPSPPPAPPPPARYQEEEEEHGDWAEVLYEYDSGEPGDLVIKENQRVLVTERTSDDWWTGEVDGKKGLFPASYVKLL
ncbi:hypothetical protein BDQ12DRAFT_695411 [Crucibulum laeve]|uniref:SH3 domain-containing protein n=1 Tax=Crucibulum laeve TaxID=68775 RepID=A0A5C3MDQ9_9AGAR|nr:hypothetical protein BDQ12DRAFT_695411 [Crucibulum laeve]